MAEEKAVLAKWWGECPAVHEGREAGRALAQELLFGLRELDD